MPNSRRFHLPDIPQHLVQRGHGKQLCFLIDADYLEYRRRLASASERFEVSIHAYVLMTNHVHLLASSRSPHGVPKLMQSVGGGYVRSFNARHGRTGTLWDGRYFSSPVGSDAYFWNCHRYIELNPVRAGMVDVPGSYRWSSYARNAYGSADPVVTPHPSYLSLANSLVDVTKRYREMFATELADAEIEDIRMKLKTERAFGNEEFLTAIEATSSRSPRHHGRGRPAKVGPAESENPESSQTSFLVVEGDQVSRFGEEQPAFYKRTRQRTG
jgi:putative transposase